MLNGQIAIVTGASRGIGEAILHALARAGATVVGTSTSEKGSEGISKWIADEGAQGAGHGVKRIVECAPGKVLTGLCKRIAADAECVAVTDSATLVAAMTGASNA